MQGHNSEAAYTSYMSCQEEPEYVCEKIPYDSR